MMSMLWHKLKEKRKNDRISEPFITLMQVAREDPEIKRVLLGILRQNEFNRTSILNTTIEEMRYKGAPESFITALACLLDKDVAQRAYDLLAVKE
jgi:hypothetical protein